MGPPSSTVSSLFSDYARIGDFNPIVETPPRFIDLASGAPDPATFPADDLTEVMQRVLRDDRTGAVGYGGDGNSPDRIYGYVGLRQDLAQWHNEADGGSIDERSIVITAGGAGAISTAFSTFASPGEVILVEAPTWNFVLHDAQLVGARIEAIQIDDQGIMLDELEATLRRLQAEGVKAKLLYTITNFNVPTGISMSLERRKGLVAMAQKWNFVVFQDDTYGDLRYQGEALPSLRSLDDSGLVLHQKSFSKIVGPSLRTGWIAGHPDAIAGIARMRRDLGSSQLISRMLTEWMRDGKLWPHINMVNDLYRSKRDAMRAALAESCGPEVTWSNPDGGFFMWLSFDETIDLAAFQESLARGGVQSRPGEAFYADGSGANNMRTAFSKAPLDDVARAGALIGQAAAES